MKRHVLYLLITIFILSLFSSGCAHKGAPTRETIEKQGDKYQNLARSKVFDVLDLPYLGAKAIPLAGNETALGTQITLRKRGTLSGLGDSIADLTSLTVQVVEEAFDSNEKKPGQGAQPSLDLPALLALPSGTDMGKLLSVNYTGPLRGLLDQMATQSGYGWDYDAVSNTITFARMMTRTYTLLATPGKVSYDNQITNKSKENARSGSIGSSNVNQSVQTADTSAQTAQTNKTELKFDIWTDTEKAVKSLLSKDGTVVSNQSAGTLTVRDKPSVMRQVSTLIRDTNQRLSRQVALRVQVWSLELSDKNEAGLDLQVMFRNDDVAITAGSLAALSGLNTATATIVSGKLKDSTAVLKALKQWGNATQVTSGGGLAMSNQPLPVLAIKRHAYLAGASTSQSDYGQTTEITPGEVTTGFSMTVIPHILDKRRVALQYNINLSSLDDMVEFKTTDITVQLPQVSTRAFSQRATMQMGQTLVLAGFQQETQTTDNAVGLLRLGRGADYAKTLLVITIELESAGGGTEV
ncbi:secretin N-terminal domain-containing protein [Desulfovibrio falkowii]|uniref:Uncharacterized protein n=1 Tax=Desulfovibrio falkowii TaxID=3136602 RepID=A0ABQ0E5W8_9BACT